MANKAMKHEALHESLAACSEDVQKIVNQRKLLKKKHPIGALDLGRLAKATLACAGRCTVASAAASPLMRRHAPVMASAPAFEGTAMDDAAPLPTCCFTAHQASPLVIDVSVDGGVVYTSTMDYHSIPPFHFSLCACCSVFYVLA
jgi:hypothetical protein